jgi:hypothetical protein
MYAKAARVATRVVDLAGGVRDMEIFLGPALHRHHETETVGERLNAEGLQFLPVEVGGKVELLQLDYIADVQITGDAPEIERLVSVGAARKSVTVHLSSGSALRGDLLYTMPKERPRVSDVLNSPGNQFLLLVQPGCCHYVNRKAVVRVEA